MCHVLIVIKNERLVAKCQFHQLVTLPPRELGGAKESFEIEQDSRADNNNNNNNIKK